MAAGMEVDGAAPVLMAGVRIQAPGPAPWTVTTRQVTGWNVPATGVYLVEGAISPTKLQRIGTTSIPSQAGRALPG